MAQVRVGAMDIEYEMTGDGQPLLLIMGLGGQLTSWPPGVVDAFVHRGFRVITFDNRDSGLSSKGTMAVPPRWRQLAATVVRRLARSEYVLADMADDALGLLSALNIEGAHVVGISMGAMIAQSMAITSPERVLSLTSIMSTTGNPKVGRMALRLLRLLPRLARADEQHFVDNQVEIFRHISGPAFDAIEGRAIIEADTARSYCPDGTVRQTMAIIASPDRTPQLRRLDIPTLVIHGLVDPLVQPSGGMATTSAVPGARLVMYPDMGHDLPAARLNEIADLIAEHTARGNEHRARSTLQTSSV